MNMKEPFVKVITQTMSTLTEGTDRDLNIGVVINSDTGPTDITKVNNQAEFVNLYLSNNQILPSDDVTVRHAYKLLGFTPLYITRATDNSVLCGLTTNGNLIYTNKKYEPFKVGNQFTFENNITGALNNPYIVATIDGTNVLIYSGSDEEQIPVTTSTISENNLLVYVDSDSYDNINGTYTIDNASAQRTARQWKRGNYRIKYDSDAWKLFNNSTLIATKTDEGDDPWYGTWTISGSDNVVQVCNSKVFINREVNNYSDFFTILDVIAGNNKIKKIITITDHNSSNSKVEVTFTGIFNIIESNSNSYFNSSYVDTYTINLSFYYDSLTQSSTVTSNDYISLNGNTYYYVGNTVSSTNYPGNPVKIAPYKGNLASYPSEMNKDLYSIYIIDNLFNDINNSPLSDSHKYEFEVKVNDDSIFSEDPIFFGNNSGLISYNSSNKTFSSNNEFISNLGVKLKFANNKSIIIYIKGTNISGYIADASIGFDDIHTTGLFIARLYEVLNKDNYAGSTDLVSNVINSLPVNRVTTLTFGTGNLTYETANFVGYIDNGNSYSNPSDSTLTSLSYYSFMSNELIKDAYKINNTTIILKLKDNHSSSYSRYLFYVGSNYAPIESNDTVIALSSEPLIYEQLMDKLYTAINNIFKSIRTESGFMIFDIDPAYTYSIEIKYYNGSILVDSDDFKVGVSTKSYESALDGARLGIISRFVNKNKIDSFSVTSTNDPEIYSITLVSNTNKNTYEFSMNPDKIDATGINIYYTRINELNKFFEVIELNKEKSLPSSFNSRTFGNESPVVTPEVDDYIIAASRFTVPNGVYYAFLFDCGYVEAAYATALCNIGKQIYAEAVISPKDSNDADQIIEYRNSVAAVNGQSSWEGAMDAPWLNDSTVADFFMYSSPGAEYIRTVLENANSAKEFAPVFGRTNGTIALTPKYKFTQEEREKMLDAQINTIVWNPVRQVAIKNLDLTLQNDKTYLSTRNNVRMINAAAHIADDLMQNYHGWFSRPATWNNVTTTLESELRARLMTSQQYGPANIKVICNETNNPVEVQEKQQLVVDVLFQFYNEIRYVYVYQKIYNLSENLDAVTGQLNVTE